MDWENPLEEAMATHSSILAWEIPWREEPDWRQSKMLQRKEKKKCCKELDTTEQIDWGQEEKGMTEDEMAGRHHRLDGHESE